jgi:transmembrane sensor
LRRRFGAWLDASPDHAADWAQISRTADALARLPTPDTAAWERQRQKAPAARHRRPVFTAGAALAACLVLALVAPSLALRLQASAITATGEQRTLRLADGSTIHLGPESAVAVREDAGGRRVRLLKGEAFFEVTHDAARPFTVRAGDVTTTDLGTAFEVRLNSDGADVAVREGRVRVEAAAATPVDLGAGQAVRVANGRAEPATVTAEEVAAWTEGQIIAKNRPVAAVVDDLRPYLTGVILLRGDHLARQPVTGVYNVADPLAALRAVARAHGATVRQAAPYVWIVEGD